MAETSTRTTRLKGETDERYETYRDDRDMTDAEALRHLIRTGLEVEETGARPVRQYTPLEDKLLSFASFLAAGALFLGLLSFAGGYPQNVAVEVGAGVVAISALIVAAVWSRTLRRVSGTVRAVAEEVSK